MRPFTHDMSRSADTDLFGSTPHSRAKEETRMQKTYLGTIRSAKASASWLGGTCATGTSILAPDVNDMMKT